jgi:hypothetical protein
MYKGWGAKEGGIKSSFPVILKSESHVLIPVLTSRGEFSPLLSRATAQKLYDGNERELRLSLVIHRRASPAKP